MKILSLSKLCCALAIATASFSPLMAESDLEKGEAFLKENAKKEGVKTTATGLQYKVLKIGRASWRERV